MEERIRALGEEVLRLRLMAKNCDPQTREAFLKLAADVQRHIGNLETHIASHRSGDHDPRVERP